MKVTAGITSEKKRVKKKPSKADVDVGFDRYQGHIKWNAL